MREWFEPKAHAPAAQNRLRDNRKGLKIKTWVYVLWSDKLQKRYIGSAFNVETRLRDHNSGRSKFTKGGIPWKLIYKEEQSDLSSARKRELFLKSGSGRKWLDEMVKDYKDS